MQKLGSCQLCRVSCLRRVSSIHCPLNYLATRQHSFLQTFSSILYHFSCCKSHSRIVPTCQELQKCFQLIFLASGSCWNLLHPPQPHSDRDWSKEGFLLFSFPWAKTNIMTTFGPAATWMSHIMGYLPRWDLMHSAPHNVKYLACRSNNFVLQQP